MSPSPSDDPVMKMRAIAAPLCAHSTDGRVYRFLEFCPGTEPRNPVGADATRWLRVQDPDRLAVEPGFDVLDDLSIGPTVGRLGDVADMGRGDHIGQEAEGMRLRERLAVKHVESRAGDAPRLKRLDQGLFFDDRTRARY